jgi:hypothetical protein
MVRSIERDTDFAQSASISIGVVFEVVLMKTPLEL